MPRRASVRCPSRQRLLLFPGSPVWIGIRHDYLRPRPDRGADLKGAFSARDRRKDTQAVLAILLGREPSYDQDIGQVESARYNSHGH